MQNNSLMTSYPSISQTCISRFLNGCLKPGGILYTSFKYGDDEVFRNGRLFSNYDEKTFNSLVTGQPQLEIVKYWITDDLRPGRDSEKWLNILLQKKR